MHDAQCTMQNLSIRDLAAGKPEIASALEAGARSLEPAA